MSGTTTSTPRRLPITVSPELGETFDSWLLRYASALELPTGVLAEALGLSSLSTMGAAFLPPFYGVTLTEQDLTAVLSSTGLSATQVTETLLRRFDGSVLDLSDLDLHNPASLGPVARREWALFQGTRICPDCIGGSPVRPLWWRLSLACTCPTHGVLLVQQCHHCGSEIDRRGVRTSTGLSRRVAADPRRCANRTTSGVCGFPLEQTPTTPAPPELIAAQTSMLDVLAREQGTVMGTSVPSNAWWTAVHGLTALARFVADPALSPHAPEHCRTAFIESATPHRNQRGRRQVQYWAAPQSAPVAAYILGFVAPILDAPTSQEGSEQLAPLAAATSRAITQRARNPLGTPRLPEPLASSWAHLRAGDEKLTAVLPARADRRLRQGCRVGASLEARHLPQLAPTIGYNRHIREYVPGTAELTGRRFTALAIARAWGASSWLEAAQHLELDQSAALKTSDVVSRRVTHAVGFWDAVLHLLADLEDSERIDYRSRRAAMRSLALIPLDSWRAIARTHGLVATETGRRNAAAWLWSDLAGGDWRESPAMTASGPSPTHESRREMYRRFQKRMTAELATSLREWARDEWGMK